jgi:hypothetical protein
MYEVCVTRDFNHGIEKVFVGISDHVEFLSTSNIQCCLLRTGEADPNGLGALREVRNGSIVFEETITAFEPPHAYEYRILSLRGPFNIKLPLHHQHGRLEMHNVDGKTRLVWTSRFRFSVPLVGSWIERKLGASLGATFLFFLQRLDDRLSGLSLKK